MSWFDNQNNVILLITIAVIVYFMMQKDNFGPGKGKDKNSGVLCGGNTCKTGQICTKDNICMTPMTNARYVR